MNESKTNEPLSTTSRKKQVPAGSKKLHGILSALASSKFRSRFRLGAQDKEYIQRKGLDTIKEHAFNFVTTRIAPAFPNNDGRQTPMKGHPVFIAQHATATCCRKCIEKWHKIKRGKKLSAYEIDFLVELIMAWIVNQWDT